MTYISTLIYNVYDLILKLELFFFVLLFILKISNFELLLYSTGFTVSVDIVAFGYVSVLLMLST